MQDRLPGELRLLGVTDIDGANNVLPRLIAKHNEKFAVLPAEQESAYVEPVEKVDVDFLFARREMRKTDCGGSISYKGRTYAPYVPGSSDVRTSSISYKGRTYAPSSPESGSMARTSLEVRETLSGKICAVYKGRRIELKEVEKAERAAPNNKTKENKGKPLKAYRPVPVFSEHLGGIFSLAIDTEWARQLTTGELGMPCGGREAAGNGAQSTRPPLSQSDRRRRNSDTPPLTFFAKTVPPVTTSRVRMVRTCLCRSGNSPRATLRAAKALRPRRRWDGHRSHEEINSIPNYSYAAFKQMAAIQDLQVLNSVSM